MGDPNLLTSVYSRIRGILSERLISHDDSKNLPHNSTTASDAQTCVRFGNRYALGRLPYAAGRQSRRIVRSVLPLNFRFTCR